MTSRVEGGLTYAQTFDAENRLVSVSFGGQTTQFVYDGDGNLVKKVRPDGTATVYIGAIYEIELSAGGAQTGATSYYALTGARARALGAGLYYVLTDHLGSASVTLDASGAAVGEQRYYPFGATRLSTGTLGTDRLFTGQRDVGLGGLIHFNARFYSGTLGRFVSADPLVPDWTNPQSLNRYSYVVNNPLLFIDPTGYIYLCDEACEAGYAWSPPVRPVATTPYVPLEAGLAMARSPSPAPVAPAAPAPALSAAPAPPLDLPLSCQAFGLGCPALPSSTGTAIGPAARPLAVGSVTGGAFVGSLPWGRDASDPDDPVVRGWAGRAPDALDALLGFLEPYAAERYVAAQQSNVHATALYQVYSLHETTVGAVVVVNRSAVALSVDVSLETVPDPYRRMGRGDMLPDQAVVFREQSVSFFGGAVVRVRIWPYAGVVLYNEIPLAVPPGQP